MTLPILTQVALPLFATAIKKIRFRHKQRDILADEEGEEAMFSSFALEEFIIRFSKRRLKITNPEAYATSKELGKLKKNSLYFAKKHCYRYHYLCRCCYRYRICYRYCYRHRWWCDYFHHHYYFTIAFQVRRNVHRKGRDFLFNGSNGENFIKIPSANLHPNGRCIHFGLVLHFSANLEIHWTSFLSALFRIVGPTARKWLISFFFFNSVLLPLKNRIRSTRDWIQQPSGAFFKLLSRLWRKQQNLVCKF